MGWGRGGGARAGAQATRGAGSRAPVNCCPFHRHGQAEWGPESAGGAAGAGFPAVIGVPMVGAADLFPFDFSKDDVMRRAGVMACWTNFAKTG